MLILYEKRRNKEKEEGKEITKVGRYSLELSAIGCVFIASKFDELDNNIPFLKDFIKAAKYMFKYAEIIKEEASLVEKFNWQLFVLSPLHFVYSLLSMGVIFENDRLENNKNEALEESLLKKVRKGTEFFADISSKCYAMLKYKPSTVAAACILCSRRVNKIYPQRNPLLSKLFGFSVEDPDLIKCYRNLIEYYKDQCAASEEDLGTSFSANQEIEVASEKSSPFKNRKIEEDTVEEILDNSNVATKNEKAETNSEDFDDADARTENLEDVNEDDTSPYLD